MFTKELDSISFPIYSDQDWNQDFDLTLVSESYLSISRRNPLQNPIEKIISMNTVLTQYQIPSDPNLITILSLQFFFYISFLLLSLTLFLSFFFSLSLSLSVSLLRKTL